MNTRIFSSEAKLKESRKCAVTGGWCATEEWPKDKPCKCDECQAWICETLDHLERLAVEAMVIYRAYSKAKGVLFEAMRLIRNDSDPGVRIQDTRVSRLIDEAFSA